MPKEHCSERGSWRIFSEISWGSEFLKAWGPEFLHSNLNMQWQLVGPRGNRSDQPLLRGETGNIWETPWALFKTHPRPAAQFATASCAVPRQKAKYAHNSFWSSKSQKTASGTLTSPFFRKGSKRLGKLEPQKEKTTEGKEEKDYYSVGGLDEKTEWQLRGKLSESTRMVVPARPDAEAPSCLEIKARTSHPV